MSATVVKLRRAGPDLLTKKQLAAELGRSERWIELRQREGLPVADTDRYGRRKYSLKAVEAWLHEKPQTPRSTADRLAALEAEMAELRAMIKGER